MTQFEAMGWSADDWHDVDRDLALMFGSPLGRPSGSAAPRSRYTLREWLRDPPAVFEAPVTRAMVLHAVRAHGYGLAPMALEASAAGASTRFVDAFLTNFQTEFRFATARPDVAWATAWLAGLSEPEATGWALTGLLLADPDGDAVIDVGLIGARLTPWVDRLGPTSYLFLLAGYTLEEAEALRDAGKSPTGEQLRVMAALNGHTLPPGV